MSPSSPEISQLPATPRRYTLRNYGVPRKDAVDYWQLVESIVYKHLLYTYGNTHKLGYVMLKGKDKKEVDFAISRPTDDRFLCEVKYKNDSSISRRDALAQLCAESRTLGAFLITRNPGDFGIASLTEGARPIIRIPAASFCYLLKGVSY